MTPAQKTHFVQSFNAQLQQAGVVLLVHQQGMTVAQTQSLRSAVRQVDGQYKVVKNRLAKLSLQDTAFASLSAWLTGPTAFVLGSDPVGLCRVLQEFVNRNKQLTLRYGHYTGRDLDAAAIKMLASLPPLDQLRGKLIGVLQAPAVKLVLLSRESGSRIARALAARH